MTSQKNVSFKANLVTVCSISLLILVACIFTFFYPDRGYATSIQVSAPTPDNILDTTDDDNMTGDGDNLTTAIDDGSSDMTEVNGTLAIAINTKTGDVYDGDSIINCIEKFDSSGKFITKWGSPGTEDGEFGGISDIAVDAKTGDVYVADGAHLENERIQKFDSNGKFITKWDQRERVMDNLMVHLPSQ